MKILIAAATLALLIAVVPVAGADPGPEPPYEPGPVCLDGPLPNELEPCIDANVLRDPQEIIRELIGPCTCDPIQ